MRRGRFLTGRSSARCSSGGSARRRWGDHPRGGSDRDRGLPDQRPAGMAGAGVHHPQGAQETRDGAVDRGDGGNLRPRDARGDPGGRGDHRRFDDAAIERAVGSGLVVARVPLPSSTGTRAVRRRSRRPGYRVEPMFLRGGRWSMGLDIARARYWAAAFLAPRGGRGRLRSAVGSPSNEKVMGSPLLMGRSRVPRPRTREVNGRAGEPDSSCPAPGSRDLGSRRSPKSISQTSTTSTRAAGAGDQPLAAGIGEYVRFSFALPTSPEEEGERPGETRNASGAFRIVRGRTRRTSSPSTSRKSVPASGGDLPNSSVLGDVVPGRTRVASRRRRVSSRGVRAGRVAGPEAGPVGRWRARPPRPGSKSGEIPV